MKKPVDRTPEQIIDAIAFALENGGIDTLRIGDNESALLVLDWREKKEALAAIASRSLLAMAANGDVVDIARKALKNED